VRQDERPEARTSGVVVKAVGDEVLVYDLARHRAHSLNPVAAAVWRACDGTRDVAALVTAAAAATGQPVSADAVRFTLLELGRARLLTAPVEPSGVTRRELMRWPCRWSPASWPRPPPRPSPAWASTSPAPRASCVAALAVTRISVSSANATRTRAAFA
jgi:hypothetical protein